MFVTFKQCNKLFRKISWWMFCHTVIFKDMNMQVTMLCSKYVDIEIGGVLWRLDTENVSWSTIREKNSLFYNLNGLLCNIHTSNNCFELTALETTGYPVSIRKFRFKEKHQFSTKECTVSSQVDVVQSNCIISLICFCLQRNFKEPNLT